MGRENHYGCVAANDFFNNLGYFRASSVAVFASDLPPASDIMNAISVITALISVPGRNPVVVFQPRHVSG
jgi:hypothetical protein